jgi:hypothetical protein
MTHPTTTLPADETTPTSPAPAPGWGDPTTPNPQWGWQQPPSPPTPPAPGARKRPGWARRNLTTLLAGAALAVSVVGLVTPVGADVPGTQGPQGVQGIPGPAGPQGERGPAGKNGKDGKDGVAAPAPEAAAPAPAPESAPAAPAPSGEGFGEGTYKVGVDIQPGEYKGTVGGHGYWARLSSSDTSDIIDNDLKSSGTMYLRVRSSDKFIEISGDVVFRKVG